MTAEQQVWGRWATLGLGLLALAGGQAAALLALTWWYGASLAHLPDFSGDGVAVAIVIFVSTPVQFALLWLLAERSGGGAADYLAFKLPSRSEVLFGVGSDGGADHPRQCGELAVRQIHRHAASNSTSTARRRRPAGCRCCGWRWLS